MGEPVELMDSIKSSPLKYPPQPLKTNLCRVKLCAFVKTNPLLGCSLRSSQSITADNDELLVIVSE